MSGIQFPDGFRLERLNSKYPYIYAKGKVVEGV
jgi:hypothetical protein